MFTCKEEFLTPEFIEEVTPILEVHRKELQSFKDMPLNPDWDTYAALQEQGKTLCLVSRDEENEVVGYSLYIISNNMHYKDYLFAIEDVFYVVNDKRGGRIGVKMVRESERILQSLGVHVITHHAKFTNRFAPFLEKLGYHKTETMLAKRIRI